MRAETASVLGPSCRGGMQCFQSLQQSGVVLVLEDGAENVGEHVPAMAYAETTVGGWHRGGYIQLMVEGQGME